MKNKLCSLKPMRNHLDIVGIFVLSLLLFAFLIENVDTDIQLHIDILRRVNWGDSTMPTNFLYYLLLDAFSFHTNEIIYLNIAAVFLLSCATAAEYGIAKMILFHLIPVSNMRQRTIVTVCSVLLFFCFAIPDPKSLFTLWNQGLHGLYIGRLVPHVWHNSTTIFMFPFALLLFFKQLQLFQNQKEINLRNSIIISVLIIINITIKPSFVFIFLPITALYCIARYKRYTKQELFLQILPLLLAGVFILIEYIGIYMFGGQKTGGSSDGVVVSKPFEIWAQFVPYTQLPAVIFFSLLFPITCLLLDRSILTYEPFKNALLLLLTGILLFAFVKETGPREFHGNFGWQNVIATFLVFLTSIAFVLRKYMQGGYSRKKMVVLLIVFIVHVFWGFVYIFKIVYHQTYM